MHMKHNVIFENHISHFPLQKINPSAKTMTLTQLMNGSRRIIFKLASVFPFDIFPDEITIDEYKVNIVFHDLFSEDIHSINIEMIKDINVEISLFFATLKIIPDGYPGHMLTISFLKKDEAVKARSIIQGLMVLRKHRVDDENLEKDCFLENMEMLGQTHL